MIPYLGNFLEDATVYLMFNTFTSDDPSASCTITDFINTDVHIHKDDGVAQRNNAAGITVSVDFDGITGSHLIKIDTSDDTVAGFWVTGHDYFVRIEGTTIDAATINAVVGQFSIENRFNEVDVTHIAGDATAATNLDAMIKRLLGMNQENFYIDNTVFSSGNMTSCRVRIYSVAGSVGSASDVIATYTMTAGYSGDEITTYKMVKA